MKVAILDNEVFNVLAPKNVEKYLATNQWIKQKQLPNDVAIWFKQNGNGDKFRVWVPQSHELGDYASMMGRVVEVVSQAKNCSQLQILSDVEDNAEADVIRVQSYDSLSRHSSSLPLKKGHDLIQQAIHLVDSAARSAIEPKPVHPASRQQQVTNYLNNIRLGQTERGSYTIKLLSPIPSIDSEQTSSFELPLEDMPPKNNPFERDVVISLVKSLNVLHNVASEVYHKRQFYFEPFEEAVAAGISANLCEAVAGTEDYTHTQPMRVSVAWSYALALSVQIEQSEIEFIPEYMPFISAAARHFRQKMPEDQALSGYVKVLNREKGETSGIITLVTTINKRQKSVKIELDGEAYLKAVQAHEKDSMAMCEGILVQKGKLTYLEKAKNFRLIAEQLDLF